MKETRAALRYAKALLNLATENNKETEVNKNMMLVISVIEENKDLSVMIQSPIIKGEDKKKVLNEVFKGSVNNLTLGMFHLLSDNKRLEILVDVAKQYTIVYDHNKNIGIAKVTTAIPISKKLEKKVMDRIVKITGHKATLKNIVNPDILGGFILRVGDVQYDASISNYLNELRKEFDHSHFIPKI